MRLGHSHQPLVRRSPASAAHRHVRPRAAEYVPARPFHPKAPSTLAKVDDGPGFLTDAAAVAATGTDGDTAAGFDAAAVSALVPADSASATVASAAPRRAPILRDAGRHHQFGKTPLPRPIGSSAGGVAALRARGVEAAEARCLDGDVRECGGHGELLGTVLADNVVTVSRPP